MLIERGESGLGLQTEMQVTGLPMMMAQSGKGGGQGLRDNWRA
jgi:hypothetical protein